MDRFLQNHNMPLDASGAMGLPTNAFRPQPRILDGLGCFHITRVKLTTDPKDLVRQQRRLRMHHISSCLVFSPPPPRGWAVYHPLLRLSLITDYLNLSLLVCPLHLMRYTPVDYPPLVFPPLY